MDVCGQVEAMVPKYHILGAWAADLAPADLYGKITWKIENFSAISKRELRSETFDAGSFKWCDAARRLFKAPGVGFKCCGALRDNQGLGKTVQLPAGCCSCALQLPAPADLDLSDSSGLAAPASSAAMNLDTLVSSLPAAVAHQCSGMRETWG